MDVQSYTWTDVVYEWILLRPAFYQLLFYGGCVALLYLGKKQNNPTFFGWYAGWVVGLEFFSRRSVSWRC